MIEAYENQLPLSKGRLKKDCGVYTSKKKIFVNKESNHWQQHKIQCWAAEKALNMFEVYSHSTGIFHSKEVGEKLFLLLS